MVERYVRDLRSLLQPVTAAATGDEAVEVRHFFSGAAAYVDGRIFMTLTTVGLALKLPKDARAELIDMGATRLQYFKKGPIKKDYVIVPDALMANRDELASWMRRSIAFARSLPQPARVPRNRK